MSEELIKKKRSKLKRNIPEELQEIKNEELLEKFYDKVRDEHFYKPWDEDTDLVLQISKSLIQLLIDKEESSKIAPGFIKSKISIEPEIIDTISRNKFVKESVLAINKFKSLDIRITDKFVDKKKAAARFLWQTYGNHIISNKIDLFFESGSTTVYVADEMKKRTCSTCSYSR